MPEHQCLKELGLADRYVKALIYIKGKGSIIYTEYQKLLSISKRTSTNDLQFLVDQKPYIENRNDREGHTLQVGARQG
jgi:hypothetical protein